MRHSNLMGKEQIKSMINLPNIMWFSIEPSNDSIRNIDFIVRKLDKGYPGKEGFLDHSLQQTYEKRVPLINYHIPDLSSPHPEGCYAISIFLHDQAFLIVIKNHSFFEKFEKMFFELFEFNEKQFK